MRRTAAHGQNKYEVNPHNFHPEVREQYRFREPLVVQDWTLLKMDHIQAARRYSVGEYVEVATLLDEIGVQEAVFLAYDYGTAKDDRTWEGIRAVGRMPRKHLKLRVWGLFGTWPRGQYRERIDRIVDTGAEAVGLSAIVPLLQGRAPWDPSTTEGPAAIEYAKEKGLDVSVSSVYMGRDGGFLEDPSPILTQLNLCIEAGASSIIMSDSRAQSTPEATKFLVRRIRAGLLKDVPIWYHARNYFGTANALTLAATTAGAWPQVSVNGIGELGFGCLEEVVLSLELLYGIDTGVELSRLTELSRVVERITGAPSSPLKAVTGEYNDIVDYMPQYLARLSGKSPLELDLSPYELELVGMRPRSAMSYLALSTESIRRTLEQMGLRTDDETVGSVRREIEGRLEALGNRYPVMIDEADLGRICTQLASP